LILDLNLSGIVGVMQEYWGGEENGCLRVFLSCLSCWCWVIFLT